MLFQPNPDYAALFEQIKETEVGSSERETLVTQAYQFNIPITDPEIIELFDCVEADTIENNPGYDEDGVFISAIGVYYNANGDITGTLPE